MVQTEKNVDEERQFSKILSEPEFGVSPVLH